MVDIGSIIKEELYRQERTVSWLARKLGCHRTVVYRIFNNSSIDTDMLVRISVILNRDFFKDYSNAINEQV